MTAVVTGLAAALFALSLACTPRRPTHVFIDPGLKTLVPPDTVVLGGARLDHLRETRFYEKLLSLGASGGLGRFLTSAGLDSSFDLWEVLIAFDWKDVVVMLRGKFSPMGLEPELRREGAQRLPYKGYMMIGDEDLAILFLNPSTAIAGRAEVVRGIVDRRDTFGGIPPPLMERIESIPHENQIWAASLGGFRPPAGAQTGNWGNLGRLLERIRGASAALRAGDGLAFSARAECANTSDAETLQAGLRGMLGLSRLGLRDQPVLANLTREVTVTSRGGFVDVAVEAPPGIAHRLLEELSPLVPW
jgi:hypothetical protein